MGACRPTEIAVFCNCFSGYDLFIKCGDSVMLRFIKRDIMSTEQYVVTASPQRAGARRVYHILGIADAAKNIFAICRRLNRAKLQA